MKDVELQSRKKERRWYGCVSSTFIWARLCVCVHGQKAKTPGTDPFSNRDFWHEHQVPLHYGAFCYTDTCSSALPYPLHFLFFSPSTDWTPSQSFFLFESVSEPPFILLSFNRPPGNGERSLQKAKAGTSLPVYIKDLSFKATGTTVRHSEAERERDSETAGIEIKRD